MATGTLEHAVSASSRSDASPFLVVLCHGFGANGSQLAGLAAGGAKLFPQARFLLPDAPQACPPTLRSLLPGPARRQWFPLTNAATAGPVAPAWEAAAGLSAQVDAELARLGLPMDAVWFVGFSQGAMVALLAGLARKVAPRGIIGIAGALLADAAFAPACKPPVSLVHGSADSVVPAARSESAARVLRDAGVAVRLEILPGLDHVIVAEAAPFAAAFMRDHSR